MRCMPQTERHTATCPAGAAWGAAPFDETWKTSARICPRQGAQTPVYLYRVECRFWDGQVRRIASVLSGEFRFHWPAHRARPSVGGTRNAIAHQLGRPSGRPFGLERSHLEQAGMSVSSWSLGQRPPHRVILLPLRREMATRSMSAYLVPAEPGPCQSGSPISPPNSEVFRWKRPAGLSMADRVPPPVE
jgi:hypothetical protein